MPKHEGALISVFKIRVSESCSSKTDAKHPSELNISIDV